MYSAGLDIGSLTAKAVILRDGALLGSRIMGVCPNAAQSADEVMGRLLSHLGLQLDEMDAICATGYGRHEIPFATARMSEISCHALGAHYSNPKVRSVIDIGGQDCKVIRLGERGAIEEFVMNDKCAAGTGRSIEMLAKTLNMSLEELGRLSLRSRRPVEISNKCSIFMELEVLDAIYRHRKPRHIACGVADAVARRVADLAKPLAIEQPICLTGGVSKNRGVVRRLEKQLQTRFAPLKVDPQLMGALGAALFGGQP